MGVVCYYYLLSYAQSGAILFAQISFFKFHCSFFLSMEESQLSVQVPGLTHKRLNLRCFTDVQYGAAGGPGGGTLPNAI